jgi:ABC-type multidrug transport system fused ATPase/permease subunit
MMTWQVLTFVTSAMAALAIVVGTIIALRSQAAYRKLTKEKRQVQKSNAELQDAIADMLTSNEVRLAYEEKRNQELEQANQHLQQALATATKPTVQQVMASEIKTSRSRAKPTARKTTARQDNGASPA